MIAKATFCFLLLVTTISHVSGRVIRIGTGTQYNSLRSVRLLIKPGDTIIYLSGIYNGGERIENLRGNEDGWITIMAEHQERVIIHGGSTAFHFTDASFVRLTGFTFTSQTENGVNIDDGGSYDTPSHHIEIKECYWRDISATGNNDMLKMSGVDDFKIENCRFTNGAKGGSLIDMVGCHRGRVTGCYFANGGSNSVQVKGGSSDITIERCRFVEAGERAVNIGGSTGMEYFRPKGNSYEAERIQVWSNIFEGNGASVAFVGSADCEVINNTITGSRMYVFMILQENRQPGMKKCSGNRFINNIVIFDALNRPAINIGPETIPESFILSNNLWFNPRDTSRKAIQTQLPERNQIGNANPLFTDSNYSIGNNSPAAGMGMKVNGPEKDFNGKPFRNIRSIGAIEY